MIGAAAGHLQQDTLIHNTRQPRHFYGECAQPININGIRQSRSRSFSDIGAIVFPADGDTEITKLAKDRYAVVEIQAPIADGENTRLSRKDLTISEIVNAMPGTLPRDFLSLKPTSLQAATTRKRRAATNHYLAKGSIHPWFILPRDDEIVIAFGCVRAVISRTSALIFDAHKPTICQQATRISKKLREDTFSLHNGAILFSKAKTNDFEIDMVEGVVREVCTMYSRRLRLYEPIVNSLLDRITNEAFSPSGLHKLVPVKDSLQHFEMNVKGALNCVTDLLDNDEDMINLQLTAKQRAGENNETLPMESHQDVELLLEEYARQLNSILLEIDFLLQRVQSKQDLVALSLDAFRNRMIRMNLYLSIGAISLAFSTATAGFYGMNVPNGMEDVKGVFESIILGSAIFGGAFLGGCYHYINGSSQQKRTLENLQQIEVMNRALGDMSALDHSFELMLSEDKPITREVFRQKVYESKPDGVRDTEIDFLFDLLDYTNDGKIEKE